MGHPGNEDLTPGDFRGGMKPLEVRTDSLASFGNSFASNAEGYFGGMTKARIAEIRGGNGGGGGGGGAIGNSDVLHEITTAGMRADAAGTAADTLSTDLTTGNMALGHAAAWMAGKYGSTDNINSSVVSAAFQPPSGAELTTEKYIAKVAAKRAEADAAAAGDPGAGADPGTGTDPGGNPPAPDPGGEGNPYFVPPSETDYDPTYTFVPPADPDVSVQAPGANYGSGDGNGSGVVA